jgi:hypothetical protein
MVLRDRLSTRAPFYDLGSGMLEAEKRAAPGAEPEDAHAEFPLHSP